MGSGSITAVVFEADGVCAFTVLLIAVGVIAVGVIAVRNGADARSVTVHKAVAY